MSKKVPAIPPPVADLQSLVAVTTALKEAVEVLLGQRGDGSQAAVTKATLPARLRELGVS